MTGKENRLKHFDAVRDPRKTSTHATEYGRVPGAPCSTVSAADPAYFSISDLAARWRCSRGSVYTYLRGQKVLDFAPRGRTQTGQPRRGHKLVSAETVRKIESEKTRISR